MEARATAAAEPTRPWTGVEVRHLATLNAVGRTGSFRGAAAQLGYVQSAVSQQIAALERAVGTRLVERSKGQRSVTLTPAGKRLAEHGQDVLARLVAARADLAAVSRPGEPETLKVVVERLIAPAVLPPLMQATAALSPGLSITLAETGGEERPESLIVGGDADVVLGELPATATGILSDELVQDPYVLLVQADSPLARSLTPPTPAQLAELPLIGQGPWTVAAERSLELVAAFETASTATATAMVRGGAGVAIVPRLALDPDDGSIAVVDLAGMLGARSTGVYRHAYRRVVAAADRFGTIARGVLEQLAASRLPAGHRANEARSA